jgi:hypothetical protein
LYVFIRVSAYHTLDDYTIDGISIKTLGEVKYFVMTLTSGVFWGKMIRSVCFRGLGFIKSMVVRFTEKNGEALSAMVWRLLEHAVRI